MSLGTEIGLGGGDIVLEGDPALFPQRGTAARNFRNAVLNAESSGSRVHVVHGDHGPTGGEISEVSGRLTNIVKHIT